MLSILGKIDWILTLFTLTSDLIPLIYEPILLAVSSVIFAEIDEDEVSLLASPLRLNPYFCASACALSSAAN